MESRAPRRAVYDWQSLHANRLVGIFGSTTGLHFGATSIPSQLDQLHHVSLTRLNRGANERAMEGFVNLAEVPPVIRDERRYPAC
jgi:hypothetical protein